MQPPAGRRVDATGRRRRPSGRARGRWSRSGRCASGADRARRRNRRAWTEQAPSTSPAPSATGRRTRSPGASGRSRDARSRRCRTSPARTWSSSAAAPRTSRPGSPAAARARSASTSTAEQLETARRDAGGARARVPARRTPAPRTCRCRTRASTWPSPSTARRIWCRPGPLDRRGGAAAAAGRRARLPRQRDAADALLAGRGRRRAGRDRLLRAVLRHAPLRVGRRRGIDFHLGYGDWIRVLARERLRGRGPGRAPGDPRRGRRRLRPVHAGVGASAGRPRRSGRPARSRERPARAAAAPRLDLAAAARDPRAARASRSTSCAPRLRGARSARRRPRELVRARAPARRGRSSEAGDRPVLGVDTTVVARRPRLRQAGGRRRRRPRCSTRSAAARTRSSRASACVTPGWEELQHETTRVTFRPLDAARPRRVRRGRRVGGRAGALRDPGPRRRARRAGRGRLPERRRPAGRAARALLAERFAGALRLRLACVRQLHRLKHVSASRDSRVG